MKKIFSILGWAALMAAGFTACSESNEAESLTPELKNETIRVTISLDESTRAFSDQEGITWSEGDQVKWGGGLYTQNPNVYSAPLTAADISEDGHSATFTFDASLIAENGTKEFSSANNHPTNVNEIEFTLGVDGGNNYTQTEAGVMNSRYLFLHNGTGMVEITAGVEPEISMEIAGSIFRVLPYTEQYNGEKVLEVSLESNSDLVGTVAYDRTAGTYEGVSAINWKKSKNIVVTLGTPFSLEGVTSRAASKGIYMAVAATVEGSPLDGYKYVVTTDQAVYTFDAMDKELVVGNNTVKNIFLKLESATNRKAVTDKVVTYTSLGTSEESPKVISGQEVSDLNIGYIDLKIDDVVNTVYTNPIYTGTTFKAVSVEDYNSEAWKSDDCEELDWLSCDYKRNGDGAITDRTFMVSATANPDPTERMGVIVVCYPEVAGYVYGAEAAASAHFPIYIKQEIYSSIITLGVHNAVGNTEVDPAGVTKKDLEYCYLSINGQAIESWDDNKNNEQQLYKSASINAYVDGTGVPGVEADWLRLYYGTDSEGNINTTHIFVDAEPNNTTATRIVNARILFTAPEGYQFAGGATTWSHQIQITQKPNLVLAATLNNPYAETVAAAGGEITAATLALTVNGEAAADVAAAMTTYGVTATVDKGATASVAADGTVTVTIPENLYKNGGVAYTLTVKAGAETLATMTINQAEGDQEQGEETHEMSYTIFNNVPDGSKGTGFEPAAFSGDYYRFENITIDGKTYLPGDELKNLANSELMEQIMEQAFAFGEITEADVQVPGVDPLTTNPESFVTLEPWCDGGAAIYVRFHVTANDTGVRRTFKIITKDGSGEQVSSIVYFQNS